MRHFMASLTIAATLILTSAGVAFAANPSGTGQPTVECGEDGNNTRPGQAATAPGGGSAFLDPGPGTSGQHYAGEQPGINDKNPHSVAQYDVACFQLSNRPHQVP
jgi:hypothetical protein